MLGEALTSATRSQYIHSGQALTTGLYPLSLNPLLILLASELLTFLPPQASMQTYDQVKVDDFHT